MTTGSLRLRNRPGPWRPARAAALILAAAALVAPAGDGRAADDQPAEGEKAAGNAPEGSTVDAATRTIEGIVVDEAGKPAAAARVEWQPLGPREPVPVTCDREGRFRLTVPDDNGAVRLQAYDDGGRRMGVASLGEAGTPTTRPSEGEVRIALRPAREITARVVGPDRRPIEAAEVEAWGYVPAGDHNAFWSVTGRTGADGTAKLRLPEAGDLWELVALKSGLGFDYLDREDRRGRIPVAELLPEVPLRLTGAQTVRVKVLDDDDRPVPGAYAYAWLLRRKGAWHQANLGGRTVRSAVGPDGIAVFDWVPAELEGGVMFGAAGGEEFHTAASAGFQPGTEGDVTMRLVRRVPIAGRVTHADGRPAAGVTVRAEGRGLTDRDDRGDARTAADGTYRILVAPEAAYVVAVLEEQAVSDHRVVIVRKGKPAAGVNLSLLEAATVRGRVTVGKDRKPAEGVSMSLRLQGGPFPNELQDLATDNQVRQLWLHRSAATDSEGRYEFKVAPGDYLLFAPDHETNRQFYVGDRQEVVQDFHQERPLRSPLAGTVVDPAGRPVAGAAVSGRYSGQGGFVREARTDPDGRFRAERQPYPLVLLARSDDGGAAAVVRLGEDDAEVSLTLAPSATATGRLVDGSGKPLKGREVGYTLKLMPDDPEYSRWNYGDGFGGTVKTDDEGRFEVGNLVVGEVHWFQLRLDQTRSLPLRSLAVDRPGEHDLGPLVVSSP